VARLVEIPATREIWGNLGTPYAIKRIDQGPVRRCMRKITTKQIEAILSLAPPKKYEHFVKQVPAWGEAWGLYDKGWALFGDQDGHLSLGLWPAPEYAALNAVRNFAGYIAKPIPLPQLLGEFLPSLDKEGTKVAVLYAPGSKGVVVSAGRLLRDLATEA
jgi:Protein of unknown function (DUF2750)